MPNVTPAGFVKVCSCAPSISTRARSGARPWPQLAQRNHGSSSSLVRRSCAGSFSRAVSLPIPGEDSGPPGASRAGGLLRQELLDLLLDQRLFAVVVADVREADDALLVDDERRGHRLGLVAL